MQSIKRLSKNFPRCSSPLLSSDHGFHPRARGVLLQDLQGHILAISEQKIKLPCGHTYLQSFVNSVRFYYPPLCMFVTELILRRPSITDIVLGSEDRDKSEKKLLEVGFWGGTGGKSWDDGFFDGLRAITVQFRHCIFSIQVTYDRDGASVKGGKHGDKGGVSSAVIDLDYPREYIECVSGHVSHVENNWLVVRSLTFVTNKRTFGPYGQTAGLSFTFPLVGLRIVGFKGRSEGYLDAVGFHVSKDASPNARTKELPIISTREMIEELLVSTQRIMIALNLADDDDDGGYATTAFEE
ncbi:hypothetical protein MLD38_004848 [Melastoma candidum]|uniref:Uncharacterized protein n=1 Tax=Melastoma candidum TaxID=119954 RepID=A0ACB9S8J0_9MYRT|nr:hypothetical protein MLD38_004848 [Melastoma candidum]